MSILVVVARLGIGSFLRSLSNTLKLARKSDRDEFLLYLKLVLIGLAVIGTIGFVIQLVASLIKITPG